MQSVFMSLSIHPYVHMSKCSDLNKIHVFRCVSDPDVTIVQPRDMNFKSRTAVVGLNFTMLSFSTAKELSSNWWNHLQTKCCVKNHGSFWMETADTAVQ